MRKLFLFAALLMAVSLYSQNWAPINSTEKFCYSTDDDLEIINNVLWVDSVEMMGNDSLFHLNKIARSIEGQDFQYLYNEPQFLLDDVIVKENGAWLFIDTSFTNLDEIDTFKIIPHANYYDSWQFSSELNAVIANVSVEQIFGVEDSIKTILLSDYSQIQLSKNFGIINWQNSYELVGINGRDIGVLIPEFEDMFSNLSAGDVICIYHNSWMTDGNFYRIIVEARYNIEEVNRYENKIEILCYVHENIYSEHPNGSNYETISGYQDVVFNRNGYNDIYPNEIMNIAVNDYYIWGNGYAISRLENFKWGGLKKTQILHDGEFGYSNLYSKCEGPYNFEMCENLSDCMIVEVSAKYGFPEYTNWGFEWGGEQYIKGVIDDGDTLGTIYFQDLFVGDNYLDNTTNWLIYPNPAKDYLSIQTSENHKNSNYKIYNLNGLLLKEGILNQNESSISIKELPKGMYFIELNINGELSTQKWIKN